MSAFSPASTTSSNPFRRNKQSKILGIGDPSVAGSSDDVSSIRSGFSIHSLGKSFARKDSKKAKALAARPPENDAVSIAYSKHSSNSGDDASSFAASAYNAQSPIDEVNPFEEELLDDDDSLDELEPTPRVRRRRMGQSRAASVIEASRAGNDVAWRPSSSMEARAMSGRSRALESDSAIPLKAQKTLGLSSQGKGVTEQEYRRSNALLPQMDRVAPKAQKMLGIPTNPFQKQPAQDETRQTFGDELEQHGAKGPTSLPKRPMDVDEFKRMLLSGEREYIVPGRLHPKLNRDSSHTDVSSLSRSSLLSAPDSHIYTPRSSHDLTSRPGLLRIATDPYDPNAPYKGPYDSTLGSPSEMADTSPAGWHKPLPHPPGQTFELAGSVPVNQLPDPSTRRRLQQSKHGGPRRHQSETIAELPASEGFSAIELPAEPVQRAQPPPLQTHLPYDVPGSESMPIELPAREATPVDSVPHHFRPAPLRISRNPPAVPPPRRAGSHRNVAVPQGIPEVAEQSPDPRRTTFEVHDVQESQDIEPQPKKEDRAAEKPPVPPARTSSNRRREGSASKAIPLSHYHRRQPSQRPDGSWAVENIDAHLRDPSPQPSSSKLPAPPPHKQQANDNQEEETASDDESEAEEPQGPASPNQLPRLQTQDLHKDNAPSSASRPRHQMTPSEVAFGTTSSNGGKRSSLVAAEQGSTLGAIVSAVAADQEYTIPGNDTSLSTGRRPSRQETLLVLNRVITDESKTDDEKVDVLADLGALQREVDALRLSYQEQHASGQAESDTADPTPASASSIRDQFAAFPTPPMQRRRDSRDELEKKANDGSGDDTDDEEADSRSDSGVDAKAEAMDKA